MRQVGKWGSEKVGKVAEKNMCGVCMHVGSGGWGGESEGLRNTYRLLYRI